jgi:hypothetical protein
MNNLPEYILDWIEWYSFEELSKEEQQSVNQFLSASEFNNLHEAALLSQQYFASQAFEVSSKKDVLINAIKPKRQQNYLHIWQVAASLLLLVSTVMGYKLLQQNSNQDVVPPIVALPKSNSDNLNTDKVKIDTVYITQAPQIKYVNVPSTTKEKVENQKAINKIVSNTFVPRPLEIDSSLNILSIADMNSSFMRNDMDTLVNQIGFSKLNYEGNGF